MPERHSLMKLHSPALFGVAIVAALTCFPAKVVGQSENKSSVQLISEEALTPSDKKARLLFIRKGNQIQTGSIRRIGEKIELALPDAPVLELTRKLETAVSLDGKTIVQYGDEVDQSHPSRDKYLLEGHQWKTHCAGRRLLCRRSPRGAFRQWFYRRCRTLVKRPLPGGCESLLRAWRTAMGEKAASRSACCNTKINRQR